MAESYSDERATTTSGPYKSYHSFSTATAFSTHTIPFHPTITSDPNTPAPNA